MFVSTSTLGVLLAIVNLNRVMQVNNEYGSAMNTYRRVRCQISVIGTR